MPKGAAALGLAILALAVGLAVGTAAVAKPVLAAQAEHHHAVGVEIVGAAELASSRPLAKRSADNSARPRAMGDAHRRVRTAQANPSNARLVQERVPQSSGEVKLTFAPLVRNAAPAVVNVHSEVERTSDAFAFESRRRPFFGNRRSRGTLGSGVIVDPSGLVVTNAHVVGDGQRIRVSLNDRREFPAILLLKDARTDLAVLQIDADTTFPYIHLGDPGTLEVGDLVLAIGNPFGVGQTVTQGIVSALARTQVGVSDAQFFIQTDAAINPGNSGGALVDMGGRLVGINTAIYSRSGGSNGIGFAIPVDMVRIVAQSARDGGAVRRPWFGARLQSVTRELAQAVGLDRPVGAMVVEVLPGSPALRAGLESADVIVRLDGREVPDRDAFGHLYATRGTSGTAALDVLRQGALQRLTVALEPPPETVARDARRIGGGSPFSGAIAMNLSPAVADELNMDLDAQGVVIARVDRASPADRVGLRPRDRVVIVNGWRIASSRELQRAAATPARYWDIVIERGGRQLSLVLGG